jgi:hypothetical protein
LYFVIALDLQKNCNNMAKNLHLPFIITFNILQVLIFYPIHVSQNIPLKVTKYYQI